MHKQQILPLGPQLISEPKDIPEHLLLDCRSWTDAVKRGLFYSNRCNSISDLASSIGEAPGTLNLALNKGSARRKRHFDGDRYCEIETVLGLNCITQFFILKAQKKLRWQQEYEMSQEEKAAAFDRMMAG